MDKQQRRTRLGDELASLRVSAGLSQAEVAARLGKPQSFVSKYESAERRLDLAELEDVAAALGSTLDEVVARYKRA